MRLSLPFAFLCSFRYDDLNAHSITFRIEFNPLQLKRFFTTREWRTALSASRGRRGGVLATDSSVSSRLL